MTEIYIGGSFSIETDVELTDEQVDTLYHQLNGAVIMVTIPLEVANLLQVKEKQFDWIDEVEVLN